MYYLVLLYLVILTYNGLNNFFYVGYIEVIRMCIIKIWLVFSWKIGWKKLSKYGSWIK
jgi:hypothetical protein